MNNAGGPSDGAPFLFSPIPKDPTQQIYLEDSRHATPGATNPRDGSVFGSALKDSTPLESGGGIRDSGADICEVLTTNESGEGRATKRPRLESESASVTKCEQLTTEIETLRVQLEHKNERHQTELKERDFQLEKLRRQLRYAVAEEEHSRKELKEMMIEYSNERLQSQKKIVETESKLQFVESSLSEWKEKAIDKGEELRTVLRQSNLKIQLLTDELEELKSTPSSAPSNSLLESKIRLLESRLRDQELDVEHANSRLENASSVLEDAQEVRELKERVNYLETHERRLKTELVGLIEASKRSALQDEKLYSMRQKLASSEQRYAQAHAKLEHFEVCKTSISELTEFFEPISKNESESNKLLKEQPATAIVQLYKELRVKLEKTQGELTSKSAETDALQKKYDHLHQSQLATQRQKEAQLSQLNALKEEVVMSNRVSAHLRKVNEELVAILQSYEKNSDEQSDTNIASSRLTLLESALSESAPMLKEIGLLVNQLSTPAITKTYESEIARLTTELEQSHATVSKLSRALEKLESEMGEMEKRLGRGEFNSGTTKVVHLAVNPTSELLRATQQHVDVKKSPQEHDQLREETKDAYGKANVPASSSVASDTKLTTTTSYETVEGQKLLNERLKKVFREQIQQYREAVYQLTGFKVDLKKSNGMELLRLRSMYADHDDDELLVRMETDGALELLDTDFCGQINQRVFAYLTTCRSFPAFLATLTLHLFEKQTFQGN